MAGADQERVAAIFLAAIDLDDHERRRYLAEACGGDLGILREVEALLEHDHLAPPAFLGSGRRDAAADATSGAPPVVGPYECIRVLGRGGQAVVWLARDRRLGRHVALKVIERPSPGSDHVVERLKREAAVVSGLRHPGICAVYDAGIADGAAFIAMQYIEGETLAQRIAKRSATGAPLAADDVVEMLRIVESLARALHVAHEAGIVHRDIKPGNVMIDREAQPVILDFGLARQDDSEFPTLTRTGNVFGTPAYMAPEQISGGASGLDRRTDVWSLGVTLYEALTLRRPFEAATPERLYQAIVSEVPSGPRMHNRAIMRDLDVVVGTAMEKSLPRRYQTALDLAEDLRRVREHEPVRARRPTPWARVVRWTARHPGLAGGVSAAFVVLVAGLIVSLSLLAEARNERELSQRRAYRSAIAAAASAVELQDQAALRRHLDDAPAELRGWEWTYLRSLLDRSVLVIRDDREPAGAFGFTADGVSLLVADAGGTIDQRDFGTGAVTRAVPTMPVREGPWFLPGGRRALLVGSDGRLVLWDLEIGRELWAFQHDGASIRSPLTADGSHVVVAVKDRPAVRILDAATGTLAREVPLDRIVKEVSWEGVGSPLVAAHQWEFDVADPTTGRVRWSGRGSLPRMVSEGRLFAVRGDGEDSHAIVGYDAASGREVERYDLPPRSGVWGWDVDPGSGTVCAGLGSGAIVFWDRGVTVARDVVLAHEHGTHSIRFAPDGKSLVSRSRGEIKVWAPTRGSSPWIVATGGDTHHGFLNSPDGRRLATTRWGDVTMWDVDEGREIWNRWLTHGTAGAMAFDATRARLAIATSDGRLHVLDAATGESVATTRRSGTERLVWAGSRLVSGQRDGAHLIDCNDLSETGVLSSPRITALAASPDASTLAIGLESGEIRIHGLERTTPSHVLSGSSGSSTALAFSRDGRLLAVGSEGGAAAVWETATGRRVSPLAAAPGAITTLVFDPAAQAVAGADEDGYIRIWDVASGFERLTLRPSVFRTAPVSSWWDESMLRFSEPQHPIVAFETLAPAGGYERRDLVRKSRAVVGRLFGSGAAVLPAADVVASIEANASLSGPAKELAVAIARARGDDLNRLNGHAWEAVLWPDRPAGYERALRQASEVCRQRPGNWAFLNTLALAQHRAGAYAAALETLAQCEAIHRKAGRAVQPSDLAIMAMAQWRLGRHDDARSRLEAARSTFFAPSFGRDEETLQLIREAETLLGLPAAR